MNNALIAVFSAIFVVSGILIYSLFRPKKKSKGNRYSKRAPHLEPSLSAKLSAEDFKESLSYEEIEDEDAMVSRTIPKKMETKKEASDVKMGLLMLYLMAPEHQPYNGYELLQALLSAGLRYGKMQIFHRHEQKTGRGDVIFSLASATSPGTFELPKMGGFSCTGLVLFFESAKVKNPRKALEIMIDTASQLAEDLGGDILDEHRHLLTEEKISEIMNKLDLMAEQV